MPSHVLGARGVKIIKGEKAPIRMELILSEDSTNNT